MIRFWVQRTAARSLARAGFGVLLGVLLLLGSGLTAPLQGQVRVGKPDDYGSDDCRVKEAGLVPVIPRHSPYFYDRHWDGENHFETARMGPNRRVEIHQHGCMRKHTVHRLYLDTAILERGNLRFYAIELFNLMNRVYFNSPVYWEIKPRFEELFIQRFPKAGLDESFNFQIAEFTFIFDILEDEGGGLVKVETVQLLHESVVKMPGIPRYKDDGWHRPATR